MLRKKKILLCIGMLFMFINQALPQRFAVIGDYGADNGNELAVANLIKSWNPDFIITVGDNNYDDGEASTIDNNIGKYFADWIYPYSGSFGSDTATTNRFFPSPGNHDWDSPSDLDPYLDYFTLPNNEYYYDFEWGDVHFFMIDSDSRDPDGNTQSSTQALWIKNKMETSTAKWKVVAFHHSPYSSAGSTGDLQWPFKAWGADAIFSGHKHNYERLYVDGLVYFVNGLGGKSRQPFSDDLDQSVVKYFAQYGAMLVNATSGNIIFSFYNTSETLIDSFEIDNPTPVELVYFGGNVDGNHINLRWRTETETNNYGFSIERSQDKLEWSSVGFVEGNGNSNSPKQYEYNDTEISKLGEYYYRLKQIDNDGSHEYSNTVVVEFNVPSGFYLSQNYPNPFNPETRINFTISREQMVSLTVYNVLGEFVAQLVNEQREAGSYSEVFNAGDLPGGLYIYKLQTQELSINKKMILIK
jgi:hypothetical protein